MVLYSWEHCGPYPVPVNTSGVGSVVSEEGHRARSAAMPVPRAIPAADIALIIFFIASDHASARSATSSIVITQ